MQSIPRTTRHLFIASLALLIVSLVVSVTNVLTAVSAPLQVNVPSKIGYEGFLTDGSGNPLADGAYDLTFKLYSVASAGTAIATEVLTDTPVTDGLYSVVLQTLTASQFDGDRWLGLTVDAGAEITPRTRITSVPFALNAQTAQNAGAVPWSGLTSMPAGFADGTDNVGTDDVGSGAAGRVAVFDSATSVAGATGLLYSNSTLTATGNLKLSGSIQQSTSLGARVYHNATQSIPGTNVITVLSFNSERWDSDSLHDTSTNTNRLTVVTPGTYLIIGNVEYVGNSTGSRGLLIRLNGVTHIASQRMAALPGSPLPKMSLSTLYDLAAGDYVELLTHQDSGVSLNVTYSANHSPEFMLVRLP